MARVMNVVEDMNAY